MRGLTPLKIRCKKDLYSQTGEMNFTMGKYYQTDGFVKYNELSEGITVIDDQGDKHQLGNWYKHFKIVK